MNSKKQNQNQKKIKSKTNPVFFGIIFGMLITTIIIIVVLIFLQKKDTDKISNFNKDEDHITKEYAEPEVIELPEYSDNNADNISPPSELPENETIDEHVAKQPKEMTTEQSKNINLEQSKNISTEQSKNIIKKNPKEKTKDIYSTSNINKNPTKPDVKTTKVTKKTEKKESDALKNKIEEIMTMQEKTKEKTVSQNIEAQKEQIKNSSKHTLIQMGSYNTIDKANSEQAKLALLNIPAKVNKVNVKGKTYYRLVYKSNNDDINDVKQILQRNNIENIEIKN